MRNRLRRKVRDGGRLEEEDRDSSLERPCWAMARRALEARAPADRHAGDADGRDRAARPLVRRQAGAQGRLDVGPQAPDHRLHRPLGLRQVDPAALPQPHERPRRRRRASRAIIRIGGSRHLRPRARRHRAAQAGGHGLPEVQPVPEVDLRERRLRPAHPRASASSGRPRRRSSSAACARAALWDEVQGPARRVGARPVRRPAAAALHRARHRRGARRAADGRAVLGARSHRHREGSRS